MYARISSASSRYITMIPQFILFPRKCHTFFPLHPHIGFESCCDQHDPDADNGSYTPHSSLHHSSPKPEILTDVGSPSNNSLITLPLPSDSVRPSPKCAVLMNSPPVLDTFKSAPSTLCSPNGSPAVTLTPSEFQSSLVMMGWFGFANGR